MRVSVSGIPAGLVAGQVFDLPTGTTVGRLVEKLRREGERPGPAGLDPGLVEEGRLVILVNGRNVASLTGMKTRLKDGDEVLFVVPAAGG